MSDTPTEEKSLSMVIGDCNDKLITVTDDVTPTPNRIDLSKAVDGTTNRPAIVRFSILDLFTKTSCFSDQIAVLPQSGATVGQANLIVDKPDTEGVTPATRRWDLEITQQDFVRPSGTAGTISVTSNSVAVVGVGTDFTKSKVGDVLQPFGAGNVKPVKIATITDATHLTVESAIFTTEPTITYSIRRGKSRTPIRGPIFMKQGAVPS